MIREYGNGECHCFRVDSKRQQLSCTSRSYANQNDEQKTSRSATGKYAARIAFLRTSVSHRVKAFRTYVTSLFLPEGYPSSVTDDFLPSATMEMLQQVCGSIPEALATRAILRQIGFGVASANGVSATISWVMRDGVRLVFGIVFADKVSLDLERRSKSWRMVGDFCRDFALVVGVVGIWFPSLFLCMLGIAACLKAIAAVCTVGTRISFSAHFAHAQNIADVTTKANSRDGAAGMMGIFLSFLTVYGTPEHSVSIFWSVFLLFTCLHVFASYYSMRVHIMDHLNAPRLEICLAEFQKNAEVSRMKKDVLEETTEKMAEGRDCPNENQSTDLACTCTVTHANNAEYLFILPPPSPPHSTQTVYHLALHMLSCILPRLRLRIRMGSSVSDAYSVPPPSNVNLKNSNAARAPSVTSPSISHENVQLISDILSCKGVALLYNTREETYFVIFSEYFTSYGYPVSLESFRRRKELRQLAKEGVKDPEAVFQQREKGNQVIVPCGHASRIIQELWACFYAYYHYSSIIKARGTSSTSVKISKHEKGSPAKRKDAALASEVYIIQSLDENGNFVANAQHCHPFEFDDRTLGSQLDALRAKDYPNDALYRYFILFFISLKQQGYRLDRLLIPHERHTIAIEYM